MPCVPVGLSFDQLRGSVVPLFRGYLGSTLMVLFAPLAYGWLANALKLP